jgi:hypothetical protein
MAYHEHSVTKFDIFKTLQIIVPKFRVKNAKIFKKKSIFRSESVIFKMTHFVFHVTQKHFIIFMFYMNVSRLLQFSKNKMCHFECHGLKH